MSLGSVITIHDGGYWNIRACFVDRHYPTCQVFTNTGHAHHERINPIGNVPSKSAQCEAMALIRLLKNYRQSLSTYYVDKDRL